MKQKAIDKRIKCYDNGGKTFDRYTVVFLECPETGGAYSALGMSYNPFHPQGFGQHCSAMLGRHLGKRILFENLPHDCKEVVKRDLREIDVSKQNEVLR